MSLQKLYFQQMCTRLESLRNLKLLAFPPANGWVRSIRRALDMPLSEMAHRLGVHSSTVLAAEKNEVTGSITLSQLKKMADVLECELVYALIPKKKLTDLIDEEALKIATKEISTVAHSMSLENQRPDDDFIEQKIKERKEELITGVWKKIWRSR